ncbi:hypothetical protein B0T25DRAFT_470206 [Lasiosphaeria hispida]|uniref:NACHT domain-containing protein n=1 Tax=Lasiosphaeria hispida TaxID=260671 RepID=A0AAJ0HWP5_9PEZI|nr:hypothetical protein B0T25DRAFT_470206 [Lasiosphaeria hispida]
MEPIEGSFQNALARFQANLTEEQRRQFRVCSIEDVKEAIKGIEDRLASRRCQRNMLRIAGFIEAMKQLALVIEVFLNVDPAVAFVWAPIKFVLVSASTWVETLDCILDTYAEIAEVLPGLTRYTSLLCKHPHIKVHLENYYCDVLGFHQKAVEVFSRPGWRTLFHSSWRTFRTKFSGDLVRLKRHRDLLSDEKITATILDLQDFRESVEEKLNELSRKVQDLHLEDEERETLRRRQQLDHKRQFVLSKLDPPNYQSDCEEAMKQRHGSCSGDWISQDRTFQAWADPVENGHKTLYLSGIPGAGKTILASRIVGHLQELQAQRRQDSFQPSIAFYFFKYSQTDKRNLSALFLSLCCQIAFQDDVALDRLYQSLLTTEQCKVRSESLLRELATATMTSQRFCFIVIDGMDECVGETAARGASESAIDWLESLLEERVLEHLQQDKRSVRLLISGQRDGFLDDRLRDYPQIRLDETMAHSHDIEAYVDSWSYKIQQRFKIDEGLRMDVVRKACSRAKGMFLYVKIVLENLLAQQTRGHFKRELSDENFPEGLDQAYQRVIACVLDNRIKEEQIPALRILKLIICATRPMMWKEIQSTFCINLDEENADPDFRLLHPCKYYCGSLVETGHQVSSIKVQDQVVVLVHETARSYLLQNANFCIANLNADMAIWCARYLNSQPFALGDNSSEIAKHFLDGYYGFTDYAAAHWWVYVKQLEGLSDMSSPSSPTAMQVIHKLEAAFNRSKETVEGAESGAAALLERIRSLPEDGRDWEDAFPMENRIGLIRRCIERLFNDSRSNTEEVQELYGHFSYKCPKLWCQRFACGFSNRRKRDEHVKEHERPFRCDFDGCYGHQIGFPHESELSKHNTRVHLQEVEVRFPASKRSEPRQSDIFVASEKGDLLRVQELVAAGADVNARRGKRAYSYPLFLATKARRFGVCQYLLDHGAIVGASNGKKGYTALHAAVLNGDAEIAYLLIRGHRADGREWAINWGPSPLNLLKAGKFPEVRSAFPKDDLMHVHCTSSSCEALDHMIQEEMTGSGIKSLYDAIKQDNAEAVKICLSKEESQFCAPIRIMTTLWHSAARWNALRVIEELTRLSHLSTKCDPNSLDSDGRLPLHVACESGSDRVVKHLLALTEQVNLAQKHGGSYTPLHLAVKSRSASTVATVLESGDVNMLAATIYGESAATLAAGHDNAEILKLLALKNPASLNASTTTGLTPLHSAAYHLSLASVQFLISNGHTDVDSTCTRIPRDWSFPVGSYIQVPLTPLLFAMRKAVGDKSEHPQNNELVLRALISLDNGCHALRRTASLRYSGYARLYLANADFSPQLWAEAARSGVALPWDLLICDDDSMITMSCSAQQADTVTVEIGDVVSAVRSSNSKYLDIAKANYPLATRILFSGEMEPGTVNFDGSEELLILVYRQQDTPLLREMIRNGFDGNQAFLGACHAGINGLIDMLLDTGMVDTSARDEQGSNAHEIALGEGHLELAQRLEGLCSSP